MKNLTQLVIASLLIAVVLAQQLTDVEPSADKRMRSFAFAKRSPYRQFAFAKRGEDDVSEDALEEDKRAMRFAFAKRSPYRQFAFAKRARFAFA